MPAIEQSPPVSRAGATPPTTCANRPLAPRRPGPASNRLPTPAANRSGARRDRRGRPIAPKRAQPTWYAAPRKFARTPKGYALIALLALLGLALPGQGLPAVQATLASVLAAAAMDLALHRIRAVPTSALITGLLVAMIMDPHDALAAIVVTSAGAVAIKHLVRTRKAHVFNPAAVALAIAPPLLGVGESWWGATAGMPAAALAPLLIAGYVVVDRVNKFPSVLAFLGVYFALFTGAVVALPGESTHLAQFYRDPLIGAVLFFACFMLTDPPTSPVRPRDQLIFGAGTAALAVGIEIASDTLTFMFLGLLVCNTWWAWRRLALPRPLRDPAAPGAAAVESYTVLERLLPGLRPLPGTRGKQPRST